MKPEAKNERMNETFNECYTTISAVGLLSEPSPMLISQTSRDACTAS